MFIDLSKISPRLRDQIIDEIRVKSNANIHEIKTVLKDFTEGGAAKQDMDSWLEGAYQLLTDLHEYTHPVIHIQESRRTKHCSKSFRNFLNKKLANN